MKKPLASLSLSIILMAGLVPMSLADVVHFYNGHNIRGKVSRVTGDVIEFKRNWATREIIKRITLTDRRDAVRTMGRTFFGEIIYIDKFKVEMQTSAGFIKLNRFLVENIVMGSPKDTPLDSAGDDVFKNSGLESPVRKTSVKSSSPPAFPETSSRDSLGGEGFGGTGGSVLANTRTLSGADHVDAKTKPQRVEIPDSAISEDDLPFPQDY